MDAIIEIKNLSFSYRDNEPVLQNISFTIKKGDYVVVLGANGSGKSTLAKLISGLLTPDKGKIYINNLLMREDSLPALRKMIGIVFQNPDNQFVGATVEDDIAFGLENNQVPHDEMLGVIEKYAKFTKMEAFLTKEPCNLSGGQKQRVAIAAVLAMSPKILILDEATSMLDPRGKAEIKEIIKILRKEMDDLTIISITHDILEAETADEVIILNKGKIYSKGKPNEVFIDEQTLKDVSLDLPFHYKIKNELSKKGLHLNDVDSEGMVEEICQSILKR